MTDRNPTYFEGDLRRELVDAALVAIAERGPSGVSLRDLARRLGVSHAAPAHHFGDKTGLFTALATEGLDQLADAMDRDAQRAGDAPIARLVASGTAYVEFAHEHPGYFDIIFRRDLVDVTNTDYAAAGQRAIDVLTAAVAESQAAGWGRGEEAWVLTTTSWAVVHGIATLAAHGALERPAAGRATDDVAAVVTRALADAFDSA